MKAKGNRRTLIFKGGRGSPQRNATTLGIGFGEENLRQRKQQEQRWHREASLGVTRN
jgi:hypothetical protein